MDDTIFDFKGEFERRKHEHEFPQSKYGFFLNLKPLPDAISSVKRLMEDHDVWFATRPSFYNPMSYTEKRVCIENHFGFDAVSKLILIPDKSLLKGDVLIDDSISDGQLEFEGTLIRFGSDGINEMAENGELYKESKNSAIVHARQWYNVENYIRHLVEEEKLKKIELSDEERKYQRFMDEIYGR